MMLKNKGFEQNLILLCVTVLMLGCSDRSVMQEIGNSDYARMESNAADNSLQHPSVVPQDHPSLYIGTQPDANWRDYNDYYRQAVQTEKDKTYFSNMQWSLISEMIQFSNFLDDAPLEDKLFYLEEIHNRSFINEPKVMLQLIGNIAETSDKTLADLAKYAGTVYAKNKNHLIEENFKEHFEKNLAAYEMLQFMSPGY